MRLEERGLTVNAEKCQFSMDKLTFFGMVLSGKGISRTEEKVKAVKEAREPRTVSETRSFLGLVNYCGRFIPDLATVSEPLRRLAKSGTPFVFGGEQKKAFQELKQWLACAETLGYFDKDARTEVIADASPVGLGAVLTQKQNNGPRVICYASRSLTDTERRYSQTEKEALALVWACQKFHPYVYGVPFDLVTEHKPLEVIYGPRSKPCAHIASELCSIGQLILRGTRIVIPKKLRPRVLSLAHEGHLGIVGTKQKLRSKVWWPGMEKDAEKHCKTCYGCQLVSRPSPPEPIRSTALPTGPWRDLAIDFSGHSPSVSPFWSSWTTIVATTR